jgi:hypothetical protein
MMDQMLSGTAAADEALGLWCDLFDDVSWEVQLDAMDDVESMVRDLAAPWPPRLLAHLYARSPHGEPVALADLVRETLDEHREEIPPHADHVAAQVVTGTSQIALGYVAEHGGVQMSGWTPPPLQSSETASLDLETLLSAPPTRLRVRLTDLGRFAMRRRLLADGATAPLTEIATL